jgi:uncharacterized membrane protein
MHFVLLSLLYLTLDVVWIYLMTPLLYRKAYESIQQSPLVFDSTYAILAYLTLLGVLYWICRPLSRAYTVSWFAYTLVGFALYAVYNLTNGAVFSRYSWKMVLIDILWGVSVFSLLGYLDQRY